MPKFGQRSRELLATAHNDLQVLFDEVIKYIDCFVMESYRDKEAQDKAFAAGNTKVRWPNSKHNKVPSLAVDVYPYPIPSWSKTSDFIYFGGFVVGIARFLKAQGKMQYEVRYGGDWNRNDRISDENFLDAGHFELLINP